jgi:hypothetical protein
VVANRTVTVVDVTWHGSEVLTLTYRTGDGAVAERLVYRDDEPRLAIVEEGRPRAFCGEGEAFRQGDLPLRERELDHVPHGFAPGSAPGR